MSSKKPPRDVVAEHEKAIREFAKQPEPTAYCCFIWPDLHEWQAIAAYEQHRALVPKARANILRALAMTEGGSAPDPQRVVAAAINSLAKAVLEKVESHIMGAMLLIASDHMRYRFMTAVAKPERFMEGRLHDGVQLEEIPGVSTVAEARAAIEVHPEVIKAKQALLGQMLGLKRDPEGRH